ncbi:MAG: RIP metalloprotease RseP, partial [Chthoniobacteraceae bacterium]|nr:RIP metalloprotease RseP [Chthoniobacteraceae bacterium]
MSTLLHILNFLFVLLEVIVLFNAIIIAHEWGHFLAARWRGLKIEEFGVWFGKPIWKKKINGVWYSLGTIPAGGFVKLPQLAPMEALEGATEAPLDQLKPISNLDKIITAFAGPLFSFGFAVVLACIVWGIGKPTSSVETSTMIGYVEPGSPAEKAGLQPGDNVLKVDGHPVKRFAGMVNSINWFVVRSEGDTIPFEIERDGKILTLDSHWIKEARKGWGREGLRQVHIGPALTTKIGEVEKNGPAAEAKLQPGDLITHVNGARIYSREALGETLMKQPEAPVTLTIERGVKAPPFTVTIQPKPLPTEGSEKRA